MMINKINGEPQINAIIGMGESDAINHLSKIGKTLRVVERDGSSLMIKGIDIDMNRVNVFVHNGIVINIDKLG